jgi:DNA-directed RNA polymerase subunit RPC12/RpoP
MAVKTIDTEKVTQCSNCKIGLGYTTTVDEKLHHSKTYMFIECPRCSHKVLTTKFNNFAID